MTDIAALEVEADRLARHIEELEARIAMAEDRGLEATNLYGFRDALKVDLARIDARIAELRDRVNA